MKSYSFSGVLQVYQSIALLISFIVMKRILLLLYLFAIPFCAITQEEKTDEAKGLEGLYVEVIKAKGIKGMPKAKTYRIFIDLKAGYELQLLFGDSDNPLAVETTTTFYNHKLGGAMGDQINEYVLEAEPAVAHDSYISLGATTNKSFGVPMENDNDGKKDGMIQVEQAVIPPIQVIGDSNLESLEGESEKNLQINDDHGTSVYTMQQPNGDIVPENKIFVGQFTTDGVFSIKLNVLIRPINTTDGEIYVSTKDEWNYILTDLLTYSSE